MGVVVLSTVFGVIAAGQWEIFLRYDNAASFGVTDPVYGNDVSFYVFVLPLYELVQGWALGAVIVITLATFAVYFINFSFRGVGLQITPGIKLQVSIMGALFYGDHRRRDCGSTAGVCCCRTRRWCSARRTPT